MRWLAAALLAAAVVVRWPPPRLLVWLRLATGSGRLPAPPARALAGCALAGGAVLLGAAGLPASQLILGLTALGASAFAARLVVADRRREAVLGARAQSGEIVEVIAGSLQAGMAPSVALERAAGEFPVLRSAAAAAGYGQDVSSTLLRVALEPGRELLADLAAGWSVAQQTGAPLAEVLGRVSRATREEAELHRKVQAAASPARATGRVMALLPLLGLGLGHVAGADPVETIWTNPVAAACVALGAALSALGVEWVNRLVEAAQRSPAESR